MRSRREIKEARSESFRGIDTEQENEPLRRSLATSAESTSAVARDGIYETRRATYAGAGVDVGRVRNRVRMTFERAHFEEVDKVVLTSGPAVTSISRQSHSDSDGIVGQRFDVTSSDLASVAREQEAEPDDDRREVDGRRCEDVVPGDMAIFSYCSRFTEAG